MLTCPKPHEEVPKIYLEIAQKASGARRDEKLSERRTSCTLSEGSQEATTQMMFFQRSQANTVFGEYKNEGGVI
jgi:hypothetical protein